MPDRLAFLLFNGAEGQDKKDRTGTVLVREIMSLFRHAIASEEDMKKAAPKKGAAKKAPAAPTPLPLFVAAVTAQPPVTTWASVVGSHPGSTPPAAATSQKGPSPRGPQHSVSERVRRAVGDLCLCCGSNKHKVRTTPTRVMGRIKWLLVPAAPPAGLKRWSFPQQNNDRGLPSWLHPRPCSIPFLHPPISQFAPFHFRANPIYHITAMCSCSCRGPTCEKHFCDLCAWNAD